MCAQSTSPGKAALHKAAPALFAVFALFTLFAIMGVSAPATATPPDLAARLARHVRAIASVEHNTRTPQALEAAASYVETVLTSTGFAVRRQEYTYQGQRVRNLEASVARVRPGQAPKRIYIVGAHYDSAQGAPGANDNGSGAAALLELARMLKAMPLTDGTELKFVFFANEEPPYFRTQGMGSWRHAKDLKARGQPVKAVWVLETIGYYTNARNSQRYPPGLASLYPNEGNFIAFVGTFDSSALVRATHAAFRGASSFPSESLVAPAFVEGVTLSDHTSYNEFGYPAMMITDTAFMRYPHYHSAQDTPDKLDYASMAQVVTGLSRAIELMAGARGP